MRRRTVFLGILTAVIVGFSPAGGPVYSRFGIGDLISFGSNRANGLGVMGYALRGDGFINLANPAGLSGLTYTRIAGGFDYRTLSLKDASGSQRFATGGFQSLALAVPVADSGGVVLFAGAAPYSIVAYDVQVQSLAGGVPVAQHLSGTGGLSSLNLGGSFRPSHDLTLGVAFSYYYGTIHRRLEADFDDDSFATTEMRTTLSHKGSGFTLGMTYGGIGSMFGNPSLPLTLGLVFTTPASLSVKEEALLLTERTADTTQTRRGSTRLPAGIGLGLAYDGAGFGLSGDLALQNWSSANFFESPPVQIRNSLRAAAGIEIKAKQDPVTYWERVAYRAGFAYTSSYVAVNGQAINSWALSGGIVLPIGPDARMSVDLTAGSRGTTDHGLFRETFFRLSVSVDASEVWFVTIEED
ncbi:MAG: hypothetical protein HBSIN02_10590 [Bacteroidia bacterium]|nr:MAG: hypothetical protein HBSIN02_10590 [Bacteroidia bacterium]